MIRSRINGKHVFGLGAMLVLLTAVLFWQASVREGQAQSTGGFNHAIVTAELDNGVSLSSLVSSAGSANAFLTAGGVLFTNGEEVGRIRIWGTTRTDKVLKTIHNGTVSNVVVATVNVNIELPGFNGTLEGQGTLVNVINDGLHGGDVIAITGGTGTFRGANGEALILGLNDSDNTFTITLQEAKRR